MFQYETHQFGRWDAGVAKRQTHTFHKDNSMVHSIKSRTDMAVKLLKTKYIMDNIFQDIRHIRQDTIITNNDYFKHIFKKTEKICGAIFYVLNSLETDISKKTLFELIERKTVDVHAAALVSLRSRSSESERVLSTLKFHLFDLQSLLEMTGQSRLMSREHIHVFVSEIDSVTRSIISFIESMSKTAQSEMSPYVSRERRGVHERRLPQGQTPPALSGTTVAVPTEDRRDRIIRIIKDKHTATIKDISSLVRDCSEKTIQRELIGLIKDGIISRVGDRRWSKYTLI